MGKYDDDDGYDNGDKLPVPKAKPQLPALLESLGFGKVTTKDEIKISYRDGVLKASVKQPNGVTQTANRSVGSGFSSGTEFNPAEMKSKDDRNNEIRRRYRAGATQDDLAQQFGLSQAMINRIVNDV